MHLNPHSLRAIREALGWSVSKFATAVETVPGHVSNIEAGRRNASPALVRRMARVLGVPVAAIVTAYEPGEVA
jgi:transcriptional regulator with XRE-family HTH domain